MLKNKKYNLNIIVAISIPHNIIGDKNSLPWKYSEDLKRFKSLTMGDIVVMGSNTYKSIGKKLPGRRNIILSTKMKNNDLEIYKSIDDLLNQFQWEGNDLNGKNIWVIGGANVYNQFLKYVDKLYITEINRQDIKGDIFFPKFDLGRWEKVSEVQSKCSPELKFKIFKKVKKINKKNN